MAPQPKRKHSQRRGRVRTQAKKLGAGQLIICPSCKKLILPHRVCLFCGFYGGRLIVAKDVTNQKEHENQE